MTHEIRGLAAPLWAVVGLSILIPSVFSSANDDPDALGPGDHMRTVQVGDRERSYLIHVPPSDHLNRPMPVVLAFHGGGGNPASMARLSGLNAKSDEAGFLVVYPAGTGRFPNRLLTFNGGNCCGYAMNNDVDEVAFVRVLLDDLSTVAHVDADRVYATGFSNGAVVTYYLASKLSDRIAAIAPIGGLMGTETCEPTRPVPVIHFHGTDDEFAPFEGGRGRTLGGRPRPTVLYSVDHSIRNWVAANGCDEQPQVTGIPDQAGDGTRIVRKTYGGGRDGAEVVLVIIEGGGHTWPGQQPFQFLGTSTQNISANDMMWEFFQKHPLKN